MRADQHQVTDRWSRRFDLTAGGAVLGNPELTRQMRWTPELAEPGLCDVEHDDPAGRLRRCAEPAGHPGEKHRAADGFVFEPFADWLARVAWIPQLPTPPGLPPVGWTTSTS